MSQQHSNPLDIMDVPDWPGATPPDSWAIVSQRDPLVLTNEHGAVGWSPSRSKAWLLPFNQSLAHDQQRLAAGERVALVRNTSSCWEFLMLVADWASSNNLDD
jgi:hypothetical protein